MDHLGRYNVRLLTFFERVPEEERYCLKENVASAKVVQSWTTNMDLSKIIPIIRRVRPRHRG